ncbi:FAD binding domain-containing protein [Geranomyces variabilis]|nr:FAD binding domain-containing protein [Geranomyces variabilis]
MPHATIPPALQQDYQPRSTDASRVDALVVGAGPVGLLTALLLARFGRKVRIFDHSDGPCVHGRAGGIQPRTLELLDQLGLVKDLLATSGVRQRQRYTYVDGRLLEAIKVVPDELRADAQFDFTLLLGQEYLERVIIAALAAQGVIVERKVALVDIHRMDALHHAPLPATLQHLDSGITETVTPAYMLACDGAHSFCRKRLGIAFPGLATDLTFGLVDAVLTSDVPTPREEGKMTSTLLVPRENGMTRLYVRMDASHKRTDIGLQDIVTQIHKVAAPFTVNIQSVNWWTKYVVGQRVADQYAMDNIFLCGDACHTHSPAAAQGMNTGIQDAMNVCWKIYLHHRGLVADKLLSTYATERQPVARSLISIDKQIASLMARYGVDDDDADRIGRDNADCIRRHRPFLTGLAIGYSPNVLCSVNILSPHLKLNHRPVNIALYRYMDSKTCTLLNVAPIGSVFHAIVFTGHAHVTVTSLKAFEDFLAPNDQQHTGQKRPQTYTDGLKECSG